MTGERTTVHVAVQPRGYDVVIGTGLTAQVVTQFSRSRPAGPVLVVTQQPVIDAGLVQPVISALADAGHHVHLQTIADGEIAKNGSTLERLWTAAAQAGLQRQSFVVAVGGGVVGDVAGFVAATYNRGIDIVQVPTTLLAQVDAAIGGKTGINLAEGKNLVGAFHQPALVCCDLAALVSLPPRIRTEGLAEIAKAGLIVDPTILEILATLPADLADDQQRLGEVVARAVQVKADIVAQDEKEAGRRAWLNFGHTWAHVIETTTGYGSWLHGEAVAVGMVVALSLGVRLGITPASVHAEAVGLLESLGLPTRGPAIARDEAWSVLGRDKKATAEGVRFVLLEDVGAPVVITPAVDDVDAVLQSLGCVV